MLKTSALLHKFCRVYRCAYDSSNQLNMETIISKYVWGLQKNDITPTLTWEIVDRARPYVNGSKACSLCLTEKFHIITSKKKLLNK